VIVAQEPDCASSQAHCQPGNEELAIGSRYGKYRQARDCSEARCKAIHVVKQVEGICYSYDPEHGQAEIDNSNSTDRHTTTH